MLSIEGIITLAKRYCLQQIDYQENYWSYHDPKTESSYPSSVPVRAMVSKNILSALERLTGDDFENIAACKARITGIAISYEKEVTNTEPGKKQLLKPKEKIALKRAAVIREVVQDFISFIGNISPEQINQVQPLPYKRRLSEFESKLVRAELKEYWNFEYFYWVPLGGECSKKLLVFDEWDMNPYKLLNEIIFQLAPQRIYEIQEYGTDYEIDVVEFDSDGYEIAFTAKDYSWIVYSSHEGTLAVGGDWLISEMEKQLGEIIKPKNRIGE